MFSPSHNHQYTYALGPIQNWIFGNQGRGAVKATSIFRPLGSWYIKFVGVYYLETPMEFHKEEGWKGETRSDASIYRP